MASFMTSNVGAKDIEVSAAWFTNELNFSVRFGWFNCRVYREKDVVRVVSLAPADVHRSLGASVGFAVAGSLLGPVGLVAGAAVGGRRRKEAPYLVEFSDGAQVAFSEKQGAVLRRLDHLTARSSAEEHMAKSLTLLPAPIVIE